MSKLHSINVCYFQRKEKSKWEKGIIFNEGDGLLIDNNGRVVDDIWDLRMMHGEFSISRLDAILDDNIYLYDNKDLVKDSVEKAYDEHVSDDTTRIYVKEEVNPSNVIPYKNFSNYTL